MSNVHYLSLDTLDPCGRPIVIVETVPLEVDVDIVKEGILQFFETVRMNLYEIGKNVDRRHDVPLQCTVILDLQHLTFQRVVSYNGFEPAP
jgi:retinaldehyde-binding protein 1